MIITSNKRAYYDYDILETFTAGIVLTGPEVKSVKTGLADFKGAFAGFEGGELWLKNFFIAPYPPAQRKQLHYNPHQQRKLLLQTKEIKYLAGKLKEKGLTLIPLKILNKRGLIKVELGLAKGRKKADKRELIKKREFNRRKERLLKA